MDSGAFSQDWQSLKAWPLTHLRKWVDPLSKVAFSELENTLFQSGIKVVVENGYSRGIPHFLKTGFRRRKPTKKKWGTPLFFELKIPQFRGGVPHFFLGIVCHEIDVKMLVVRLCNKNDQFSLCQTTIRPHLPGGSYPTFQKWVKKVGSLNWCQL